MFRAVRLFYPARQQPFQFKLPATARSFADTPSRDAWPKPPNANDGPYAGIDGIKRSTYVTGLPVIANSREVLAGLLEETLDRVKVLPEDYSYRKELEHLCKWRLEVVKNTKDVSKIEEELAFGPIEEVIEDHHNELEVIEMLLEDRPWEGPMNVRIGVITHDNENIEDPVKAAKFPEDFARIKAQHLKSPWATEEEIDAALGRPHAGARDHKSAT